MSFIRKLSCISELRRRRGNEDEATSEFSTLDANDNENEAPTSKPKENDYFVHGDVYFSSQSKETSKFMIVPSKAEVTDVLHNFNSYWNLNIPRVALFVLSHPGPKYAWKDHRNMNALVAGLVNALNTIEMWIFTNGLDTGIAMEIGTGYRAELLKRHEAFFSHFESYPTRYEPAVKQFSYPEVALIGACNYDSLTYAHKLIKSNRPIRLENEKYISTEETYDLNEDHSHFLVIKDKNPSGVHDFLFKVAEEMSKNVEHHSETSFTSSGATHVRISEVSVVALLLQGGLKVLDFIRKHLERKLPLIVVKGSGGLADLLAYTYYEVRNMPAGINPVQFSEKVLKRLVIMKAESIFPSLKDSSFEQRSVYEKLLQCVKFVNQEKSKLLTVLDTTQKSSLDNLPHHLLKALFKCKPAVTASMKRIIYMRQNLHLAMDWNSPLIAMEEVLGKGTNGASIIDEQLFTRALLKPQREGFVEMFLQQGFQVHKILNSNLLVLLFNASTKEEFFQNVILERMMGQKHDIPITKEFLNTSLARFIQVVAGLPSFIQTVDLDRSFKDKLLPHQQHEAEEKALLMLVVWAICTYRLHLLKAIWKNTKHPMRLAIFISLMLKKVNHHVYEVSMKNHLKKHHVMFSKMGIDVLDMYYKDSPSRALNFVQEKSSVWCYKTVMEIAAFANNKHFLAHPCCQQYLDGTFMGHIRLKSKSIIFECPVWVKVLLAAFLVFPMYIWFYYYELVDDLVERDIGKRHKDLKYVQERFSKFGSHDDIPKKGKKFDGKSNYVDDADPHAYFYCPVQQLEQINPNILDKIYYIWTATITKFWMYHFFYLAFLILFSTSLLWPSCGNHTVDVSLFIWTILLLVDTTCTVYILHKKHRGYSIKWDVFQVLLYIFFLCVFGVNRIATNNKYISTYQMKVIMGFLTLYLYYRFTWSIMPISATLGPLLYRAKRMILFDFKTLVKVSLLFMVSNVLAMWTLLYPDGLLNSKELLAMIATLFSIFKTPHVDYAEINTKCIPHIKSNSENSCLAGRYDNRQCENFDLWSWVLRIQFTLPLQWILIPILYSMFGVTHRLFQAQSDEIWKFQRYQLVMEFQDRPLPFPFSLVSYFRMFVLYVYQQCIVSRTHQSHPRGSVEKFSTFNHKENVYFMHLFKNYCETSELGESRDKKNMRKEIEMIKDLGDGLLNQKKLTTELESHLIDLQVGLNYTNSYLLYQSPQEAQKTSKKVAQQLSRQNPYPHTQIKRYPVPDKRVSWEQAWFSYDPVTYTLAKECFSSELQDQGDEDLYSQSSLEDSSKRPEYLWNQRTVTAAGIFLDRLSWITDECGNPIFYEIDSEGLPRNPLGRTGLRGKGFMSRWGPNHHIYVFVTSWCLTSSRNRTNYLKFVAIDKETEHEGKHITLPGGFLTSIEAYDVMQKFFKTEKVDHIWQKWDSSEVMISYFRSCAMKKSKDSPVDGNIEETITEPQETIDTAMDDKPNSIEYQRIVKGYMDDPLNTDNAWFELELWHIHFDDEVGLETKFKPEIHWEILNHETLRKLPKGLAVYIKDVTSSMKAVL